MTGGSADETERIEYVRLSGGDLVVVRPIRSSDEVLLAEAFEQLSEQSVYRRFLTLRGRLTGAQLSYLTAVDHHDQEAIIALTADSGSCIGVARFVRSTSRPTRAEVAVTVIDRWHRRGVAAVILGRLTDRALAVGIDCFSADVQSTNRPLLNLLTQLGGAVTLIPEGTTTSALIRLG